MKRSSISLLAILVLVNVMNYVDRQIIFPLYPILGEEFQLSDFQLGLLGTVLMVVHAGASLPFGWLADRWSRKKIISFAVLFWSGATMLTGLAHSFRTLLLARSLVGVGESAYAPAGTAMISDAFPSSLRARVQSIFTLGMFAGGIAGMMLSGVLAESFGWRSAFFIVAAPGALLALGCLKLPEPKRTQRVRSGNVWGMLKSPAYVFTLISSAMIAFSASAYVAWTPTLAVRYHGFSITRAGIALGLTTLVGGLCGVFFGGWLADKLNNKFSGGRALAIAVGFLISSPFSLWAVLTESQFHLQISLVMATFFLTWYHGPATAVIHDLAPLRIRSAAFGLYMLFIHLLGTATAPPLIGLVADRVGLRTAMIIPVAVTFLSGIGFLGVSFLMRNREPESEGVGASEEGRMPGSADRLS